MSGFLIKVETLTMSGGDPFLQVYVVAEPDAENALAIASAELEIWDEIVEIVGPASDSLIAALSLQKGELANVSY